MSPNAARWVLGGAVAVFGVVLVGDLALIGLLPIVAIAAIVSLQYAANRGADGPAGHVRDQVRRQLLMGTPNSAAELVIPMLNSRSPGTRRFGAEMLAVAAQAGADEPAVLDVLPRLTDLAPTYRIGRALVARGRAAEAVAVLEDAADGHDPVGWAEYVGALAGLGRYDEVRSVIAATPTIPPIEAAIHAVRHLAPADVAVIREALAERLGSDAPAVMVLDVKLGQVSESLPAFVAAHQTTNDGNLAAWVAWAGSVLGSPVALEHLDRIVGQAASARTSVAVMLASVHLDHPAIALRIAPSAIRSARIDARVALQLTNAQALAAVGRIDDAVQALYLVPSEMSLVAAITPPLAPAIQESEGYTALVDHIVSG